MSDLIAKLVVLGDQGVGKTSLTTRYVEKRLNNLVCPTVGASYFTTKIKIEGLQVELQVWDTAGQERFKAIVPMFYRKASAAILVFDITRRQTFENIKVWITELKKSLEKTLVFSIVGNKSDLSSQREVTREEGVIYANNIGAAYFECSAHTNQGVDQIFSDIARKLIRISGKNTLETESYGEYDGSLFANCSDLNATDTGITETPSWSIGSIAHGQSVRWNCC